MKSKNKGGQTGADRAALEAAKNIGIETGGTAPKKWMTEYGPDDTLRSFGLIEGPYDYRERTKSNVDDSDATIVFRFKSSPGTDCTIGYAQTHKWTSRMYSKFDGYKPVLVVHSLELSNVQKVCNFIEKYRLKTLNVAGHRDSTSGVEDFAQKVQNFLEIVFETITMAYI